MRKQLAVALCLCLSLAAGSAVAGMKEGMVAYQKKEYPKAIKEFKKDGGGNAAFNLGSMYYKGEGVKADPMEGASWFKKSAEKGYPPGQFVYGTLLIQGDGVQQDRDKGIGWLRKSAAAGHTEAQFRLGVMYINGDGVGKDRAEAEKWLKKASKGGHVNAKKLLKALGQKDKQEKELKLPPGGMEAKKG